MMSNARFVLVGGRALVGEALEPIDGALVVVEAGRITSVGSGDAPPEDVPRVDVSESTLIPGFIDAHVHIGFYDPRDVLRGGVTTARDLGWPPDRIFPLVRRSASPEFPGPRVLAAGPMLTVPDGYPTRAGWAPPGTGLPVGSISEARDAVDRIADDGACVVKVALSGTAGPTLDLPTLAAIVDRAHARTLRVTGHVDGLDRLELALDAGLDELAHMLMSPQRIPEATLRRMVSQGVTIVPTLAIFSGRARRIAIDNVRNFLSEGGRVIYGTDLGNAGPRPGIDEREVRGLVAAGMSGTEIVAAATVDAARWLGLPGTGVLESGADADLVAVDGDAVSDPLALTRVRMVWRAGIRA